MTTKNNKKIVLLILALVLICTAFAGCYSSGTSQPVLEATEEEQAMEPQLRRIAMQNIQSVQVNIKTATALFMFAGETENVAPEDDSYKNISVEVKLVNEEGVAIPDNLEWEINDNGLIMVKASEMGTLNVRVESSLTGEYAEVEIPVVRQSLTAWDIIILGIGMYALYLGISGKGKIYESEFIKEGKEDKYKLVTRLCCIVVAALMIASGVISAVDTYGSYSAWNTYIFIAAIVVFIAGIIGTRALTDVNAKKEAEAKRASGRDMKAPTAAFVFDDDEPTVDDIMKK